MDEQEARLILAGVSTWADGSGRSAICRALAGVGGNPELARWFAEEQAFDRAIAAHLGNVPAPFGLKTRILAQQAAGGATLDGVALAHRARPGWPPSFFFFAQVVGLFRPAAPNGAGFELHARDGQLHSVSDPPLDMQSDDLGAIEEWLSQKEALPRLCQPRLALCSRWVAAFFPFAVKTVTLICFKRENDGLAHLFVVDRAALPQMKSGAPPVFAA